MVVDYDLDGELTPEEINSKLNFAKGRDDKGASQMDYAEMFPPTTAESNYQKLMAAKLYNHRDGVRDQYWQQGYLGRFVVYLIDRII